MLDKMQREWVDACAKLAADELRWDGDTVELPNGETLTLHVEPDQDTSILDEQGEGVWCGRLEWAEPNHYTDGYVRPEWADGAAELLRPWFTEPLWWRPATDVVKDRELRDRMRRSLLELLEFGYSVVTVEAFRHRDIYGRGCVEAVASLGSVEACLDGVLADVVPEVVAEVLEQIGEQS